MAVVLVAALAASTLLPAERFALVAAGLGLALTLAALHLATLSVLGGRTQGALILLQMVCSVRSSPAPCEHDEHLPNEPLLALMSTASVEGRVALGPESGQ